MEILLLEMQSLQIEEKFKVNYISKLKDRILITKAAISFYVDYLTQIKKSGADKIHIDTVIEILNKIEKEMDEKI